MRSETSKELVLAAAATVRRGEREPTMGELAVAAGVSVRTLYRQFGTREALLQELGAAPEPAAREQILEAALDQVGRRGLAEVSMDGVAEAAGVSRATLYRLFPGKPALFRGLIETYSPWEAVADTVQALDARPPDEVMPAVGQALAAAMDGRMALLLGMVSEVVRGDPDTVEGIRRTLAHGLPDLVGYLTRQMEAGRLRRMEPVVAFQLLAGPIATHLLTRPLAESLLGLQTPLDEVVGEIVAAWLRATAPAGPDRGAATRRSSAP